MTDEELQSEREAAYRLGVEEGLAMAREVSVERDKALAEVRLLSADNALWRQERTALRSELSDVIGAVAESSLLPDGWWLTSLRVERDKALAEVKRLREEVDAVRSELIDVLSAHGEPVEKWSGRAPN